MQYFVFTRHEKRRRASVCDNLELSKVYEPSEPARREIAKLFGDFLGVKNLLKMKEDDFMNKPMKREHLSPREPMKVLGFNFRGKPHMDEHTALMLIDDALAFEMMKQVKNYEVVGDGTIRLGVDNPVDLRLRALSRSAVENVLAHIKWQSDIKIKELWRENSRLRDKALHEIERLGKKHEREILANARKLKTELDAASQRAREVSKMQFQIGIALTAVIFIALFGAAYVSGIL